MHIVLETLQTLGLCLWYILEAIVCTFIPTKYRAKNVENERVLITGAGSGLGRNLALRFAEKKSVLLLWDINESSNEETASMCREIGATVHTYTCDISNREKVYEAADKVKDDVRDIDILVNNAGIVTGKKLEDCPDSMIEKTMQINAMAHFWTLKAFLPSMMARNHGHIVTIASGAGICGVAGLVDYCGSKFAAVGIDESIRHELIYQGKSGVKTTVVCPTFINTGMFTGAKTSRFESIMGNLETDDAVNRILSAILTNQQMLIMPRFVYLLYALKGMMPGKMLALVLEYFHVDRGMSGFVGREKSD